MEKHLCPPNLPLPRLMSDAPLQTWTAGQRWSGCPSPGEWPYVTAVLGSLIQPGGPGTSQGSFIPVRRPYGFQGEKAQPLLGVTPTEIQSEMSASAQGAGSLGNTVRETQGPL